MAHQLHGRSDERAVDTSVRNPGITEQSRPDADNGRYAQPAARDSLPTLLHKVKNEKSILAIIVSSSRIYAGTQGGEILVSQIAFSSLKCTSYTKITSSRFGL